MFLFWFFSLALDKSQSLELSFLISEMKGFGLRRDLVFTACFPIRDSLKYTQRLKHSKATPKKSNIIAVQSQSMLYNVSWHLWKHSQSTVYLVDLQLVSEWNSLLLLFFASYNHEARFLDIPLKCVLYLMQTLWSMPFISP